MEFRIRVSVFLAGGVALHRLELDDGNLTSCVRSLNALGNVTLLLSVANSLAVTDLMENAFSALYSSNKVAPTSLSVEIETRAVALVTSFDAVSGFTLLKKRIGRISMRMMIPNQMAETNRSIMSVLFFPDKKRPSVTLRTDSHLARNRVDKISFSLKCMARSIAVSDVTHLKMTSNSFTNGMARYTIKRSLSSVS